MLEAHLRGRAAEQPSGGIPVDVDSLGLADAVGARHGLQVVLGVPVRVEDDDGVRRGQVDAQAARPRRQQERKVRRTGRVEVLHGLQLTALALDPARSWIAISGVAVLQHRRAYHDVTHAEQPNSQGSERSLQARARKGTGERKNQP